MIDTKQFRRGNLINCYDIETETWCVDTIERISESDIHTKDEIEGGAEANGEYAPVELSEEWLLRFGCKKTGSSSYPVNDRSDITNVYRIDELPFSGEFHFNHRSHCGSFYYWWCHGEGNYEEPVTRSVQFLHELQNLYFALTGKELTIKP